MFPHHIQQNVFSNLYFKGTCYLVLAYFTICGGNAYSIAPAIITGIYAIIIMVMAPKSQKVHFKEDVHGVGDQYLPEISISDSHSQEDIDTLITEYEPPMTVPGLSDFKQMKQPVTDFNAPVDSDDEQQDDMDTDITPPPQSLVDRVRSGSFKAVGAAEEPR